MKWVNNHIEVEPSKRPKKLTGTRLGAVLGLNPWSTPFEVWCAITRTYEKPFEDTIYTLAGKIIEPKQIEYMKKAYAMDNLKTPTDVYGSNYFKKTFGDFFGDTAIFGGMWDSLLVDENGKPEAVLEFKTTKRSEDWENDIPEYYAIQAALYAYLLKVDDVIMVASFLENEDYQAPEKFTPNVTNTITVEFKVSERYTNFKGILAKAIEWWDNHVETGISPDFDEKKDVEILKALRANNLTPDTDLSALIREAEELQEKLDKVADEIAADEKRLKTLKDLIKESALGQFREGDKQVIIQGPKYEWVTSRNVSFKFDENAMEQDGVLGKYKSKENIVYRLISKMKEDSL